MNSNHNVPKVKKFTIYFNCYQSVDHNALKRVLNEKITHVNSELN